MDYQNGKVYRIDCLITNEVYIGSTCQPTLAKRLAQHVSGYRNWKNGNGGKISSYLIIERGNYKISLIELCPCNSKDELTTREGYYIRTMECVNKLIPGRTKQDYYKDKKEQILEQRKGYYKDKKEQILEKMKDYYEANREQIAEYKKQYDEAHKDQKAEYQKQYNETHKEQNAEYQKQYNETHKEIRNKKNSCECGGKYTTIHKLAHYRSLKHKNSITGINRSSIEQIHN